MRKLLSFALGAGTFAALVIACSSSDTRPPPAQNAEGGTPIEGGGLTDVTDDVVPKSCISGMKENDETDVDCGGKSCPKCAIGKICAAKTDCEEDADCETKVGAKTGVCAKCNDGIKTPGSDETDVDCGGSCKPCGVGKTCKVSADCAAPGSDPVACSMLGTGLACACPPGMTIIALSTGGAYCVDQAEVSKGQYNAFITSSPSTADQEGACKQANNTFIPRAAWPPATVPTSSDFTFGLPVHYVDWCDAYAYCKSKGRRLCGTLDGKPVTPGPANNMAASDAWYNACSAQGKQDYPYAVTGYQQMTCNGDGVGAVGKPMQANQRSQGFGHPENQDDGVYLVVAADGVTPEHNGCQGGSTFIYQMSGNVAEWEDSCDDATATSPCRVRGGSYKANNDATALRCDAVRSVPRMPTDDALLKDIGFRCCLY